MAATAALLGGGLFVFGAGEFDWSVQLYLGIYIVYLAVGVTAWWRRPGNRMGTIIIIGSFAVLIAGFGNTSVPTLHAIGAIGATLVLAVLIHLLHAFPSGRLRGAASKTIVIAAYANSVLLQAPSYLFIPDVAPSLHITALPAVATAADLAQSFVGLLITLATALVLARRMHNADHSHRRVLIPLFAYGLFAVLFIPFSSGVLEGLFGVSPTLRGVLQLIMLGGVPIAFVLGMIRGGFSRTAGLTELGSWLGSTGTERSQLNEALSRTVGDPTLEIAYWVDERGTYIDAQGAPVALPAAAERRAAIDIELDGRLICAIIYDTGLIADADSVRAAARLVALALDRARLAAELNASERALADSRERLKRADATRHDGGNSVEALTRRQREVLALIAEGRSNAAIARELVLTEKSVVNHVSRIFDALDLPVEADDHRRVRATVLYLSR
ncbi:hypothetical protein GCM10027056_14500 [Glaciibacter psychrotolerans]